VIDVGREKAVWGRGGVKDGGRDFDGCEWSSYIIAEVNLQINARDVTVTLRSSGPGETQIGFLNSRDYPFPRWGSPAVSDFSTAALLFSSCRTLELVAPIREKTAAPHLRTVSLALGTSSGSFTCQHFRIPSALGLRSKDHDQPPPSTVEDNAKNTSYCSHVNATI
jgi:hypothetical protein